MTDTRKTDLIVGIDATQAEQGLDKLGQKAQVTGDKIKDAGEKGAQGFRKFGGEADRLNDVSSRSFSSLISGMEKVAIKAETAGQGMAAYFRALGDTKKFTEDQKATWDAMVARISAAEGATKQTTEGFNNMGMSAKQLANATRQLPAQFTDIFVSLATGQPPMMVMLQQGGQIKDLFGGIGNAAKAVGQALLGLVNPWTVSAAAVIALGYAYSKGAEESQKMRAALIDTGNAAGVSVGQLQAMAERMDTMGVTQHAASEALVTFVKNTKLGAEELERFSLAALKFAEAGGQGVEKTAEAFASLEKDPLKSVLKLNEGMNFLSTEVYETIRSLELQGRTLEATKVAQEAYARALEERTPEMLKNLGYIETAWYKIKKLTGEAVDAILGIGREGDKLKEIGEKIALARDAVAKGGANQEKNQAILDSLIQQANMLYRQREIIDRNTAGQREQLEIIRAREQLYGIINQNLSKEDKAKQAILQLDNLVLQAHITDAETLKQIERTRAAILEKAKEKNPGDGLSGTRDYYKDLAKDILAYQAAMAKAEGETDNLTKSQVRLLEKLKDPIFTTLPPVIQQWYLQVAYAAIAEEQAAEQSKEWAKQLADLAKEQEKSLVTMDKETEAIEKKAEKLEIQAAALGKGAGAQQELTAAVIATTIAELEAYRATDMYAQESDRARDAVDRRIDALKRLQTATEDFGEAKQAEEIRKSWEKITDQVENSLTDALMRGFEGGKDFLDNLLDAIRNGFKTLVVRFLIEPVMKGVAQAGVGLVASMFGGTAQAGGGYSFAGGAAQAAGGDFLESMFGSLTGSSVSGLGGAFAEGAWAGMLGDTAYLDFLSMGGWGGGAAEGAASYVGYAAPYIAAFVAMYLGIKKWKKNRGSPAEQDASWVNAAGDILPFTDESFPWMSSLKRPGTYIQDGSARIWVENVFADILKPLATGVRNAATSLGGSANPNLRYGLLTSTSPDGRGAQVVAAVHDFGTGVLYDYNENGPNETVEDRIKEQLPRMFLAGLIGSNIDEVFKDYFESFDLETVTQDQVNAAVATAQSAKVMADATEALGGSFLQLKDISVDARANILALSGGLSQFLQKTATYLDLYYDEAEKASISAYNVAKTLVGAGINIEGLDTAAEFRQIVESLDLSTEVGQRQLAALLEVAPAFYNLAAYMAENGVNLEQLAGGTFKFNPGWNIVAGPGEADEEDMYSETAPWLPDLVAAWNGAIDTHMTNLNTALTEAGTKTAQAITDVGGIMADAADKIGSRPVDVTVNINASEVNGGVIS